MLCRREYIGKRLMRLRNITAWQRWSPESRGNGNAQWSFMIHLTEVAYCLPYTLRSGIFWGEYRPNSAEN